MAHKKKPAAAARGASHTSLLQRLSGYQEVPLASEENVFVLCQAILGE